MKNFIIALVSLVFFVHCGGNSGNGGNAKPSADTSTERPASGGNTPPENKVSYSKLALEDFEIVQSKIEADKVCAFETKETFSGEEYKTYLVKANCKDVYALSDIDSQSDRLSKLVSVGQEVLDGGNLRPSIVNKITAFNGAASDRLKELADRKSKILSSESYSRAEFDGSFKALGCQYTDSSVTCPVPTNFHNYSEWIHVFDNFASFASSSQRKEYLSETDYANLMSKAKDVRDIRTRDIALFEAKKTALASVEKDLSENLNISLSISDDTSRVELLETLQPLLLDQNFRASLQKSAIEKLEVAKDGNGFEDVKVYGEATLKYGATPEEIKSFVANQSSKEDLANYNRIRENFKKLSLKDVDCSISLDYDLKACLRGFLSLEEPIKKFSPDDPKTSEVEIVKGSKTEWRTFVTGDYKTIFVFDVGVDASQEDIKSFLTLFSKHAKKKQTP
jgi:hypothetical protein